MRKASWIGMLVLGLVAARPVLATDYPLSATLLEIDSLGMTYGDQWLDLLSVVRWALLAIVLIATLVFLVNLLRGWSGADESKATHNLVRAISLVGILLGLLGLIVVNVVSEMAKVTRHYLDVIRLEHGMVDGMLSAGYPSVDDGYMSDGEPLSIGLEEPLSVEPQAGGDGEYSGGVVVE